MKKLSSLIAFLFCAVISFGQFAPNPQGTVQQVTQFRGAVTGLRGIMITPNDTLNSPATPYFGALTVLPQDAGKDTITIWMSNGLHWIRFTGGSAFNRNDTIYTRVPIAVDTTSLPGHQILYLLHLDGVVTPGYVIWTGTGLIFNITPANYYINYRQYNSPSTTVTLATADPSLARSDLFYVDTTASAQVFTGMPGGGVPQTNPSSQLPLTSIQVNAGDTVPSGIQLETLYNQHIAPPTEWLPTTSGTGTTNFDNTDFPYIGTKAAFTHTYANGYKIIFTKGSGTDTVKAGEIIRGFLSLNIPLTGQFQFQWFNGATPVSNSIAINSGFGINPNNVGQYQIFAIPLNTWNFNSNIFNKLVITMAGADTSGAGGFYLDFLQLQTGLTTFSTGRDVYSFSKNASNDSDVLVLSDGTRLVVVDNNSGGGGGGISHVVGTNGLSNVNDSTVKLGGFLTENTTILGATHDFSILNSNVGIGNFPTALFQVMDLSAQSFLEIDPSGLHSFMYSAGEHSSGIFLTTSDSVDLNVRSVMNSSADGINVPFVEANGTNDQVIIGGSGADPSTILTTVLIQDSSLITASNGYVWTLIDKDIGGKGAWQPAGGGASLTWQQTLINGSTLNQNNTIDAGGFSQVFSNGQFVFQPNESGDFEVTAGNSGSVSSLVIDSSQYSFIYGRGGGGTNHLQIDNSGFQIYSTYSAPIYIGLDNSSSNLSNVFMGVPIMAIPFTPANSTDATYPNGALTEDNTFLYYRTSTGTWKKIPWVVF